LLLQQSHLAVFEGGRVSGRRDMRLLGSGILLQASGTMSHCPKTDPAWDPEECAQLWERRALETEEEE